MCSGGLNFETVLYVSALALALRSTKKALFSILSGGLRLTAASHFTAASDQTVRCAPWRLFLGLQLVKTAERLMLLLFRWWMSFMNRQTTSCIYVNRCRTAKPVYISELNSRIMNEIFVVWILL